MGHRATPGSKSELNRPRPHCGWCAKEILRGDPWVTDGKYLMFCSIEHRAEALNSRPPSSSVPEAHRVPVPEVGENVLYVLPDGPNQGYVRPATIVSVSDQKIALLYVLTAGTIDGPKWTKPQLVLSAYSECKEWDTWHRKA